MTTPIVSLQARFSDLFFLRCVLGLLFCMDRCARVSDNRCIGVCSARAIFTAVSIPTCSPAPFRLELAARPSHCFVAVPPPLLTAAWRGRNEVLGDFCHVLWAGSLFDLIALSVVS